MIQAIATLTDRIQLTAREVNMETNHPHNDRWHLPPAVLSLARNEELEPDGNVSAIHPTNTLNRLAWKPNSENHNLSISCQITNLTSAITTLPYNSAMYKLILYHPPLSGNSIVQVSFLIKRKLLTEFGIRAFCGTQDHPTFNQLTLSWTPISLTITFKGSRFYTIPSLSHKSHKIKNSPISKKKTYPCYNLVSDAWGGGSMQKRVPM